MSVMNDEEKLAVLGFSNLEHSLLWYRQKYKDLHKILEFFIINTLINHGVFPKDARNKEKRQLYHEYYLIIEHDSGKYYVKINNTDRGEVVEQHIFNNVNDAARFLIKKSYTDGGSINQY